MVPKHLSKLIASLKKLPGVGNKTAERYAFNLLEFRNKDLKELAELIDQAQEKLRPCSNCGALIDEPPCLCQDPRRAQSDTLCIVAHFKDVYAIEDTRSYLGHYHVLGGLLSPLDGIGPDTLNFQSLKNRLEALSIREVVIAIDSTLEGDATSLYLKRELEPFNITVSRLAFGLPMGSSLDYVDGGTLAKALTGRRGF